MPQDIFFNRGVVSSVGKGITTASLGRVIKSRGLSVSILKLDPYLNVDPGTMSPYQHGEVFVTEDGAETDLDLGHYERFIDENLRRDSNVTAGSIYWTIVTKERRGEFLGGTVQIIPHVTNEIKNRIRNFAENDGLDVAITEVGGTVGDLESLPFLEAIRQLRTDLGKENVLYIHVTLIPYLEAPSELKTKPTQHSVKELRSIGIQPDIIVCRSGRPLDEGLKEKIALFCDVEPKAVISAVNVENVYSIPLVLNEEGLDTIVVEHLKLPLDPVNLSEWKALVDEIQEVNGKVKIAIVGKYVKLRDAYISVVEALKHAGFSNKCQVRVGWVDADALSPSELDRRLSEVDGILVPGGFGVRGIEGKIKAIRYAREKKVPFLGICLGLQCAVVEYARNVVGFHDANSSEFNPNTSYPVIDLLPEQKAIKDKGGTMRLGIYPCELKEGSKAKAAYGDELVYERHRHRYEVSNIYREKLSQDGMVFSGLSLDQKLVEIVELKNHPFFVASPFHPEFKSRPNRPHPLFKAFIKAAFGREKTS